jgi:hypothetical protein
MCFPIAALGLTAVQTAMVGVTLAASAAAVYSQNQTAKATAKAITQQNEIQADEINRAAGEALNQRARAAREERAQMRASAAASGINLGSNSFIAALQTSAMNQYNDQGLIIQNAQNRQSARQAEANTAASGLRIDTGLSAALKVGGSTFGAYYDATNARKTGATRATG